MTPAEIVEESRLASGPCLFSGAANPSDVCQVWSLFCNMLHKACSLDHGHFVIVISLEGFSNALPCFNELLSRLLNRVDWVIVGF